MGLRIAFVNPPTRDGTPLIRTGRCQVRCLPGIGLWPPISLAGAAAAARAIDGVDAVWLSDGALTGDFAGSVTRTAEFGPDLLVVEGTTPTLADDLEFVRRVKDRQPLTAVMYGLHSTARPEDVLDGGIVDGAIIGEPEQAVMDLCRSLSRGRGVSVAGIATRDRPASANRPDLDSLPWPARDLLDNRRYRLAYNGRPFTIIQVARGCRHRCVFCTSRLYSGSPRFRGAESIVGEVRECVGRHGIRDFMFLSDTFTDDPARVRQLCETLLSRQSGVPGVRWVANSRTDSIDPQTAKLMRRAGCWLVSLGIESGCDEVLRAARKGTTAAAARSAVDVFRRAGIKTIGYFMFGLPGESLQSIDRTIQLAITLPLDYAYFYTATPFPGTELFKLAQKKGWLQSTDWSRYFHGESDVMGGDGLTAGDLAAAVRRGYRRFYLRPSMMVRHLAGLRSPRAVVSHLGALVSVIKRSRSRREGRR